MNVDRFEKPLLSGSEGIRAKGRQVDVEHLFYRIQTGRDPSTRKVILRDISFSLSQGSLCALMGPSGSGKSTLLDLLADRKVIGEWSGEILFNGGLRSRWFQRDSAYILQDDLHIPTLTVRESIEFSAKVRLIEGTTAAEINERVDLLLDLMGLEHVQDSLVGGQKIRGISGGQLKRLSIAVEIVSLPDFIALDEPTSGLDSFMALEVMNTVKKLCLQNRTCVSTIHQPSAQVFALFDTIILIADGRLIYAGGTKDVLSYFQSLGFHYEIGENPAEFVIEISQSAVSSQRYGYQSPQQLEKHFQAYRTSKKLYQPYQRRPSEETVTEFQLNRLHATTKSTQFVHLLRRELLAITRNRNEILALVVKNMVVACLIGIIFFNQVHVNLPLYDAYGVPKAEVNNISALLFFGLMHTMVSNVESIPHLCARHAIFQREVNAFAYSVSPYWLAHSLSVLPVQLIGFLSFIFICYFLCSFPISWEYFFYFSGILWIASLSSYYLAMAIAAWTADEKIAFIVFPLTFLFFSTFSGYAIAVDEVPKMWSWAPWISYVRWAFEGLMTNQWEDYSSVEDNDGYSTVLSLYDFEGFDKGNSFWIMALVVGFNMLLAYVAMRPKPRQLVKLSMQGMTEHEGSTHSMVMESVVASNPLQASIESSESLREKLLPTSPQRSSQSQSIAASLSQRLSQPSASSASSASTTTTSILKGLEEGATSAPFLAETPSAYHFADIENSPGLELLFRDLHYFIPNPHYSPNRDLRPGSHVSSPSTSGKHNSNSSSGGVSGAATSSSAPLGEGGKDLHVLKGISGIIKAGQMTALMGSSGAGKSTLLDILAMRKTMGDIRGAVLINNKVQSMELMQSSSAYVMQENVFLSCLTVEETLYFAAQLRLPERWSKEEKDKRVQQILSVLALHPVADSFVGDEVRRGISGGQKKRLAIGIEIIHLPDILFLDEPTTGLDSSIAYEVLATVQTLTHYNRTILCTIHQPSLRAFNLFDSILLLAQGRLIYCGPTKDIIAHFRSCPYRFQCPSDVNPADFIIDIAMGTAPRGDPSRVTAEDLERVFETSPQGEDLHDRTHNASASLIIGSTWVLDGTARDKSNSGGILGLIGWAPSLKATTSLTHQLQTLLHRRLLQKIRNMHQLVATFGRYIAIALFYGTVYYQLPNGDSSNAYNNRLAIIFFSLLLVLMGHQEDIPSNLEDRLLFYRERAASAYGSLAYWLSSVLITVPYSSFMVFLYSLVVYWMIGFRPDLQRFGYFVYIMIVTDIIGYMVCQLVSNLSSSAEIAMSFFPVAMFFATAFEGFIVYLPQFPDWLGWGGYVSYMRFSFQALVLNEFQDNPKLPLASSYLSLLGFHSFDRADCAGLLWVFVVMHTLASFYCLIRFNFEKR